VRNDRMGVERFSYGSCLLFTALTKKDEYYLETMTMLFHDDCVAQLEHLKYHLLAHEYVK